MSLLDPPEYQKLLRMTTVWRVALLAVLLSALIAFAAHSEDAPAPPKMSVGVSQCNKIIALWIVLQNGRVVRMDKDNHPDTPEHQKALLEWVKTGPSDIYVAPCGISI